jgi:acyl-CoA hydrolase
VTNNAYLVYVALDPDGRPTPVPRLTFTTDDERRRAEEARERQAYRKRMSHG